MKLFFKLGAVICVIAFSMSAFAGSIDTFTYTAPVSGVSNTTVTGTFSYDTATDTFTSESLSFVGNSIFGGLSGTVTKPQSGSTFVFNETIDGYTISYDITLNVANPGSYTASGYITNRSVTGAFSSQVPEAGSQLSYLAVSAFVLLTGILLSRKQRALAEN